MQQTIAELDCPPASTLARKHGHLVTNNDETTMLICFDFHDEIAFHAVVFANTAAEAVAIAKDHVLAGFAFGATQLTWFERQLPYGGEAQRHMIAAIEQGAPGIGHLQPDGSWLIAPPGKRPAHSLSAPRTTIHPFDDDDGDQVVIFAHTSERAMDLFAAITVDYRALPKEWRTATDTWDHWQTLGLVRHGEQAIKRGIEGLGIYNQFGWSIFPLDYERLDVPPP